MYNHHLYNSDVWLVENQWKFGPLNACNNTECSCGKIFVVFHGAKFFKIASTVGSG